MNYESGTFDPHCILDAIAEYRWSGEYIDDLSNLLNRGARPSSGEVERILIRMAVRMGKVIGNSQFSGQWESQLGSYEDTIACIAVDLCRELELIEERPNVSYELKNLMGC